MKKTLITLTSLLLICIIMIGCNSTDATISTSQDLNKNLNILSNTVRRLDTIDNAYLMSSDLYSTKINQSNNIVLQNEQSFTEKWFSDEMGLAVGVYQLIYDGQWHCAMVGEDCFHILHCTGEEKQSLSTVRPSSVKPKSWNSGTLKVHSQ